MDIDGQSIIEMYCMVFHHQVKMMLLKLDELVHKNTLAIETGKGKSNFTEENKLQKFMQLMTGVVDCLCHLSFSPCLEFPNLPTISQISQPSPRFPNHLPAAKIFADFRQQHDAKEPQLGSLQGHRRADAEARQQQGAHGTEAGIAHTSLRFLGGFKHRSIHGT